MKRPYLLILVFFYLAMPLMVGAADCECEIDSEDRNKSKALPLKLAAIFSILVAGGIGVCLPTLSKVVPALQPKASSSSSSPPPPGDTVHRTHTHTPRRLRKLDLPLPRRRPVTEIPVRHRLFQQVARQQGSARGRRGEGGGAEEEEERSAGAHGDNNGHVHTHATHGSTALTTTTSQEETRSGVDLVRHRVVSQAKFKVRSIATMAMFFSPTTLVGIVVGIEISSSYNENSPTALIVEGLLNSVAVGILIYMALVDLLATNFMNPKVQNNGRLQLGVNISLLLSAGLMSLLAKWA